MLLNGMSPGVCKSVVRFVRSAGLGGLSYPSRCAKQAVDVTFAPSLLLSSLVSRLSGLCARSLEVPSLSSSMVLVFVLLLRLEFEDGNIAPLLLTSRAVKR